MQSESPDNQAAVDAGREFCRRILVEVSRSFALIIPECPPPIDRALCVAYLLCRIADTIEDEPALSGPVRERLYDAFLRCVDEPANADALTSFLGIWPEMEFAEPGYGELVANAGHVLAVFADLPAELTEPIRRCVHEMVAGMRDFRPAETVADIAFVCRDLEDLDRYCHIVAGTVGVMSTALFEWRFRRQTTAFHADATWREQGRRLGLGLQMTNILKDCRVDARRGVSFVPRAYVDLERGYELARDCRGELFAHAVGHLDAGLRYALAVPQGETGIRRFLLGSLLPAIATLEVAAAGRQPHPKIDRSQMAEILELIVDPGTTDETISRWFASHRRRTLGALV